MPVEIICTACSAGPCKLGDLTRTCENPLAPEGVVTVQDMVNYNAAKLIDSDKH